VVVVALPMCRRGDVVGMPHSVSIAGLIDAKALVVIGMSLRVVRAP
jgi:hypothetical protein